MNYLLDAYLLDIKIYKECTKEPYSFLTIDTILPGSDPLRFRKKLFRLNQNSSSWSAENYW